MNSTEPVAVSLEQVNKLVQSANTGYNAIQKSIDTLDKNVLADLSFLAKQQAENLNLITEVSSILVKMTEIMAKQSEQIPTRKPNKKLLLVGTGLVFASGFVYGVNASKKRTADKLGG